MVNGAGSSDYLPPDFVSNGIIEGCAVVILMSKKLTDTTGK